jgi:hypothetical protein
LVGFRYLIVYPPSLSTSMPLIKILSCLGLYSSPSWYAPLLLDLIPQVRLMSFLLDAISRNTGRMGYTLLLAVLLLYMYSVLTIAFFPNQYALAGQFDCTDLISCFKLQIDYGLVNPPEWVGSGYINPFYGAPYDSNTWGYVVGIMR